MHLIPFFRITLSPDLSQRPMLLLGANVLTLDLYINLAFWFFFIFLSSRFNFMVDSA